MKKSMLFVLVCMMMLSVICYADTISVDSWEEVAPYYVFTLDGIEYSLPCPVSMFLDNGWELYYGKDGADLAGSSYTYEHLIRDDKDVMIDILNASTSVRDYKECTVVSVEVEEDSGVDFALCSGITLDSTANDVIAAYGADEGKDLSRDNTYYRVRVGEPVLKINVSLSSSLGDNRLDFEFDGAMADNAKLKEIEISYMMTTPEDEAIVDIVTEEIPAVYDSYAAPESLSDNIASFEYCLGGRVFAFPTVTSQLEGIVEMGEDPVAGWSYQDIKYEGADGGDARIKLENPLRDAVPPVNTYVGSMRIETSDFELPCGVKIGMTKEELLAALPVLAQIGDDGETVIDDVEYESGSGSTYTTYEIQPKNDPHRWNRKLTIYVRDGVVAEFWFYSYTWQE